MTLKEYVRVEPVLRVDRKKRAWEGVVSMMFKIFFNTLVPFIVGYLFVTFKNPLILLVLLFNLFYTIRIEGD